MLNKILKILGDGDTRKLWSRRLWTRFIIKARKILAPAPQTIKIGNKAIGEKVPVFIIAEIGINHNGKLTEALKLIDAAAEAGADAVKFQKRQLLAVYQKEVVENPNLTDQALRYVIPILKESEFGEKEYRALKAQADKHGLVFFATPFDEQSVDFLKEVITPPLYKVSSADLVNIPLLERLLKENKPLIVSTGMSTIDEIERTVAFLHRARAVFVLLHCQSSYPAGLDTLNLSFIKILKHRYGVPVGYSGHETGLEPTLAAVALGARVIERHITLDREAEGPDHAASLLPSQFKELVKKIRECEIALGLPVKQVSRGEVMNKLILRKSLTAGTDIAPGTKITRDMITVKGPGFGISPQRIFDLVGKTAKRLIAEDEFFTNDDLDARQIENHIGKIETRWGLKARFFELNQLMKFEPKPTLLEFHVNDKDLDFKFEKNSKYPFQLFVHAPEYNERTEVDLASENERIWKSSIEIIQKTIDKTREIAEHFEGIPGIVIHVGGITITPHPQPKKLLNRAIEAFKCLDYKGVTLLPENLPAFSWHFGGLWKHNVFGAADEMIEFCNKLNLNMCLDLSHAWLFCAAENQDYLEYIKKVAPLVRHLHIADGRGCYKEGLQIGEGDVPFEKVFEILEQHLPKESGGISWIPEIWQGHLNDYREFRIALAKLSKYKFLKGDK